MRKLITYIFTVIIIIGCTLDLKLDNELSDPDVVVNSLTARNTLVAGYNSFPSNLNFELSIISSDFQPTGDAQGEDPTTYNLYNYTPTTMIDYANSTWNDFYKCISNVNNCLIRSLAIQNKVEDKSELYHIIAEAYTLKAYCYLYLLQLYSTNYSDKDNKLSIVIRDSIDENSKDRQDKDVIIDNIESLLQKGEEYFKMSGITHNNYLLSLKSLIQIRAKLHLYQNNFDKCIKDCEDFYKIIPKESIIYKNYDAQFWGGLKIENSTWSVKLNRTNYYQDIFGQNIPHYQRQCYAINPKLIIHANDPRYNLYMIEPNLIPNAHFNGLYLGKYNYYNSVMKKYPVSYSELRPAEIIFIEAEARWQKGEVEQAKKLLTNYYGGNNLDIINNIQNNLSIIQTLKMQEFIGENLNFFDIKRWGLNRDNYTSRGQENQAIKSNDYRFTWPIPPSETKYNNNITHQNEGWPSFKIQF